MKQIIVVCVLLAFTVACDGKPSSSPGKPEVFPVPKVTVEKERVEKTEPLPPEVKIKLRRDGKDNYSWELSGSDADQILKVNEKLRKGLGGEQQK
ncbi:MAG: hypothetical protein KGZ49_05180 [Syntrophaceae bacterium]|nr:hypothetical protein [Syntrophaceae bacterium]